MGCRLAQGTGISPDLVTGAAWWEAVRTQLSRRAPHNRVVASALGRHLPAPATHKPQTLQPTLTILCGALLPVRTPTPKPSPVLLSPERSPNTRPVLTPRGLFSRLGGLREPSRLMLGH